MNIFAELEELELVDNTAKITKELERADYLKLHEVLENIGGKWNTGKRLHVFDYNPKDVIIYIVDNKELPSKNPHAYFPTPQPVLNDILLELGFIYSSMRILESSAGTGHIIKCLRNHNYDNHITAFKLDKFRAAHLLTFNNVTVRNEDFLLADVEEKYDLAIINPPFSVDGSQHCYIEHIQKTFNCLNDRGKLAAITPINWLTSNSKRLREFRDWVYRHGKYYKLDKEAFKESCTLIQCAVLIIDKEKDNTYQFYGMFDKLKADIEANIINREEIWLAFEKVIDFIRKDEVFLPWLKEWNQLIIEDFINENR